MLLNRIILFLFFLFLSTCYLSAQVDTSQKNTGNNYFIAKDSLKGMVAKDVSVRKKHIPRIATQRSALFPGWGQAYNREYWKIPLAWIAVGIPAYTFFYNNSYYKKTKFAYSARYRESINPGDTSEIRLIDPQLKNLDLYSLETYRNSFRKDRDYSILWFAIMWGVNVVDATVFAHLKDFDVSSDLSMHVRPSLNIVNGNPNVSFAINTTKPQHKLSILYKY